MDYPTFSSHLESLIRSLPHPPSRWTRKYHDAILERINKRIDTVIDRVDAVATGRTPPTLDQVAIGSGRRYSLSVLFLDICSFSNWPSADFQEQRVVLAVMDIFMAEMMNIVRDFNGTFEKNTGDGLMAYFGARTSAESESVREAVEAATIMHYVNDHHISLLLENHGLWRISFRVGIDFGQVTIGRVGIPGGLNSFVAISSVANCACKLMELIPAGGICLGNEAFRRLPANWNKQCRRISDGTGFVYKLTGTPYPAWELSHRLFTPLF